MSERERSGHVLGGDGLRGLGAVGVLLFHAYIATIVAHPDRGTLGVVGEVLRWGDAGLFLFFAVSGYLVGGPFARAFVTGGAAPAFGRYVQRRLRRILPAFLLVLALLVAWFGSYGASAGEVAAMFLLVQNQVPSAATRVMPQAWTLGVELTFYLALPLLFAVAARTGALRGAPARRRMAVLLGLLVATAAGSLALRTGGPAGNDPSVHLGSLWWAFVPGLALATAEPLLRPWLAARPRTGRATARAAGLVSVLAFAALVLGDPAPTGLDASIPYLLTAGGLLAAVLLRQWSGGGAARALDNPVAHALGRWSYGIYLVHVGVGLQLLEYVPEGASNAQAVALLSSGMLAGSIAIAAVLWWLVEQPAITGRAPALPGWVPAPQVQRGTQQEEDERGVFIAGDTLRAFASTTVLVAHCVFAVALLNLQSPLDAYGALSEPLSRLSWVIFLFFALSGYLVGGPFARAWLRGGGWPDLRRYTRRRVRRIVPAFWVVLLVLIAIHGVYGSSPAEIALMFAFAQSVDRSGLFEIMPQGWTLGVEVAFYIAVPLLVWALVRLHAVPRSARARRLSLFGTLGLALVVGTVLRSTTDQVGDLGGRNLFSLLHAFVPGILLAAVEEDLRPWFRRERRGRLVAVAAGLLFPLSYAFIVVTGGEDGVLSFEIASTVLAFGIVAGPLMWQWATASAPIWLDNRVFRALGRWSYGIYLIHIGVLIHVVTRVPGDPGPVGALVFVVGVTMAVTVVLSALLYWLVEEPFMARSRPRPILRELAAATRARTSGAGGRPSGPPASGDVPVGARTS